MVCIHIKQIGSDENEPSCNEGNKVENAAMQHHDAAKTLLPYITCSDTTSRCSQNLITLIAWNSPAPQTLLPYSPADLRSSVKT